MWQGILVVTAVIYGWGFAIAVLYEEWMYFIEEGLFSWLFFVVFSLSHCYDVFYLKITILQF